jgi:hypothetical protein
MPLLATLFTDQFAWEPADFMVFGALLLIVGILFELVVKRVGHATSRSAFGIALGTGFLLVWVNAGVGIIGNENNDANMLYGGVLAVGISGSALARFQHRGMSYAMIATALAQLLTPVIALAAGYAPAGSNWPVDVVVLTGFFTLGWLLSAWLFHTRVHQRSRAA